MTRIRVSGLLAHDSLLLTFLSAPELFLTLGHTYFDQAHFGPTTPTPVDSSLVASVDPSEARKGTTHTHSREIGMVSPEPPAFFPGPLGPAGIDQDR